MEQFSYSPENKKEENDSAVFRARLTSILNTAISVENINDYANTLLDSLVTLTDDVTNSYRQKYPSLPTQTDMDLENEAYNLYELPNLGGILDKAQEKLDQISHISQYIITESNVTPDIITPPNSGDMDLHQGEEKFRETKLLPRLTTLLYILETDFNIPKENVLLTRGSVLNNMVRREPYYRVDILDLNRLVYICDEEGNATYVFDQEKLREMGITIEQLDIATKDERNAAIAQFPGIGRRLIQTKYWRENISELLSSDVSSFSVDEINEHEESSEQFPRVSTSELDPYRGYWMDTQGKHWGTIYRITQHTRINEKALRERISNAGLTTIRVADVKGLPRNAYCLEEVLQSESIIEYTKKLPFVSKEGDWAGFYTDPQGLHWSSVSLISDKAGLSRSTITKYIKVANLHHHYVRNSYNQRLATYCYEEVTEFPGIKILQELPKVATVGEWKGFWTDKEGRHWGPIFTLTNRTGISGRKLTMITERLQTKKILDIVGRETDSYCQEEIEQIPELQEYLKLPYISHKGESRALYIDPVSNTRMGTIPQLAEIFGIGVSKMSKVLRDRQSIQVRSESGPETVYSYDLLADDRLFQEKLKLIQESKKTETIGEWKYFYIDEQGKHWGTTNGIALRLNRVFKSIFGIINRFGLPSIKILVKNKCMNGYCIEDIANYLAQK